MIIHDPLKWTPELAQRVVQRLEERGAVQACPRCANRNCTLAEGFTNLQIQSTLASSLTIGEGEIPCVVTVCTKCGYTTHHALGALGLLKT